MMVKRDIHRVITIFSFLSFLKHHIDLAIPYPQNAQQCYFITLKLTSYRAVFLSPGATDTWGLIILCGGGRCPMHHGMASIL